MIALDYDHTMISPDAIIIPLQQDPCSRIRINTAKTEAILEHVYCDVYDYHGEEIEEWTWRRAYQQPDVSILNAIMEELNDRVS